MDHVAIMRRSWGLTQKILNGEKKIESRWYKLKCRPWDNIKSGDRVYFKDSGEPVTVKATVRKVIQFSDLTPEKVKDILNNYGKGDGIKQNEVSRYYKMFKNRKYCLLIFLKEVKVIKPFYIDKSGFGAMAAWITVGSIDSVKKF